MSNMKKVLIIEDDPILQKIYREKLEKDGYEVLITSFGEEGLQIARDTHPDFIVLDLMIPKIHGAEVLRILKSSEDTKDIPVGILTVIHPDSAMVSKELMEKVEFYWLKDKINPKDVSLDIKKVLGE